MSSVELSCREITVANSSVSHARLRSASEPGTHKVLYTHLSCACDCIGVQIVHSPFKAVASRLRSVSIPDDPCRIIGNAGL